jgi:hypothetical protein
MLALLGVLVPWLFRPPDKMSRGEKAFWALLMMGFLLLELRTLYLDRDEHDREQAHTECERLESFKQIAKGIEDSNEINRKQFSATMIKFREAIDTETGGDSFCYLDFFSDPIWYEGVAKDTGLISLVAVRVGKYPLRDISVTVSDPIRFATIMDKLRVRDAGISTTFTTHDRTLQQMMEAVETSPITYQVGDFATDTKFVIKTAMNPGDVQEFEVLVRSFNTQMVIERFKMKRVNGHWAKAILVEIPRKLNSDWTKIDADFPRRADGHLDVNWPRDTKGRDKWDH